MAYQHDDKARREASAHAIADDELVRLQESCRRKVEQLGPEGVRGHCIRFSLGAWGTDAECLPEAVRAKEAISRGDVFDIATQVLACNRGAADLLTASFIWGMGLTGYGPRRYRDIRAAARGRVEEALRGVRAAVSKDPRHPDPVTGYAQFYGGTDYEDRAAPGDERWSRLRGYGPAFFTKFLYFSTPAALILDARMARAVSRLSNLPNLVNTNGTIPAWTPYRYSVYLHWMNQTAEACGATPELLELTLFEPPPDPPDEGEAAD